MKDKISSYVEKLFKGLPHTQQVADAKEEMLESMLERYDDCLQDGMDEQEAYDTVIDSIGDIRELLDELETEAKGENSQDFESSWVNKAQKAFENIDIGGFVNGVTDFTSGLVAGLFSGSNNGEMDLVNSWKCPSKGISNIEVTYISDSISVGISQDDTIVIHEYMNQNDPRLMGTFTSFNGCVKAVHGKRQGTFMLRSRIEVLIPKAWNGSLNLSTVSGSIKSAEQWNLGFLSAKTVSGTVEFDTVSAGLIRLSSTSGNVKLAKASGRMELRSVSGSVRVEDGAGSGKFKSTSGSIRVLLSKLDGHIEADTVSGGVRLGIPADASFEFDAKSVTGSISTGFDPNLTFQRRSKAHGFVGSPPYYQVMVSTTSGGIHVND